MPTTAIMHCMVRVTLGGLLLAFHVGPVSAAPADRKVQVSKLFQATSGIQRQAADSLLKGANGDFEMSDVQSGKALVYPWMSAKRKDVLFLLHKNKLDYPQLCFMVVDEKGAFTYGGCASTSSETVFRLDRGSLKKPLLRVKQDSRTVDYCWDGNQYAEKASARVCH